MTPSSTPKPFHNNAMFELFNERNWSVIIEGIEGEINVHCTMARPDAINEGMSTIQWPKSYDKAGRAPWGKHADRNKGVSIVRARRELCVSTDWVNNYEPEERWWSVEIEFDPILDEIFGVVNNKQHAHLFVSGAGFKWEDMADADESYGAFCERLRETSDPRYFLVDVWTWIDKQIVQMRKEREKIMRGTGSKTRHPDTGEEVEDVASKIIKQQKEEGETGESDDAPEMSNEDKLRSIAESARSVHVNEETAEEWAKETVYRGRRVLLKSTNLGHKDAFFNVQSVSDVIVVWLNDQHPFHTRLIEILDIDEKDQTPEELIERLNEASFTLRMLLIAWARYEDKSPTSFTETLSDIRMDWGRETRKFLDV